MRKTFYDKTGRCPRTLKEAFGPYADHPLQADEHPEELIGPVAVFVCTCAMGVATLILLFLGLI